jgi:hypothetical protein
MASIESTLGRHGAPYRWSAGRRRARWESGRTRRRFGQHPIRRSGASRGWSVPGSSPVERSDPRSRTSSGATRSSGSPGFFLLQRINIEFVGQEVAGIEVIGYDPETDSFPSTVYSNFSPTPLPYRYEVDDDQLKISVSYGPDRRDVHRRLR